MAYRWDKCGRSSMKSCLKNLTKAGGGWRGLTAGIFTRVPLCGTKALKHKGKCLAYDFVSAYHHAQATGVPPRVEGSACQSEHSDCQTDLSTRRFN